MAAGARKNSSLLEYCPHLLLFVSGGGLPVRCAGGVFRSPVGGIAFGVIGGGVVRRVGVSRFRDSHMDWPPLDLVRELVDKAARQDVFAVERPRIANLSPANTC